MGLGPAGRPAILPQSRASRGFDLAGRSPADVLARFAGRWDGALSLAYDDGARLAAAMRLYPNGTFATAGLRRVTARGVSAAGTLRGRCVRASVRVFVCVHACVRAFECVCERV